ncbi:putative holin-like toxin [Lachnospiraceae bacterium 48-42]
MHMSTYEVLTLLILFGTFLIALLAYLDNRNNKRK